jgi:Domain of unknown function (DUF4359)
MKRVTIIAAGLGLGSVGLGLALAMTNPAPEAFAEFALQHLREAGCQQIPFGLASQCPRFVDDNKAQIQRIMADNTERQDFILFSIYQTHLSTRSLVPDFPLMPMLPTFHFQTVGILGNFYLVEAKKEREPGF